MISGFVIIFFSPLWVSHFTQIYKKLQASHTLLSLALSLVSSIAVCVWYTMTATHLGYFYSFMGWGSFIIIRLVRFVIMSLMSCDHVTIIPSHSLIGQPFCRSATHFWRNSTHFNESCYTFSLLQIELLWYLGLPEWRIFGIQNTQSHSEKFRLASLVWVYSIYVGINFVLPSSTYLGGFFETTIHSTSWSSCFDLRICKYFIS